MNGANFWHNQFKNSGTIEHLKVIETRSGGDRALIKTLNSWKDSEGKIIGRIPARLHSVATTMPIFLIWKLTFMQQIGI